MAMWFTTTSWLGIKKEGFNCLKHGIKKGNTIVAVGHSLPCVKVIRHYVEACIVYNMKPAGLFEMIKVRFDRYIVEKQLEDLSI